ncbi:MAG: hypothetical protein EBR82_52245 [Caulobacteraceae bacterium]|nr:hypothetical protein [bacterium]NBW16581.1 hypothetical protein [Caulobacteraceae bacterium]NDG19664.1 hypothetical protein [Betaproteobacteria bacterium]
MSNSNIQAVTKTADAHAIAGRTRVVGLYFTNTNTASSFSLKNGSTDTGTALITINTPAAAGANDIIIPDMGILFDQGVYIDVANANILSVTLLFQGGAAQ